jgi:phage terminase small subunit
MAKVQSNDEELSTDKQEIFCQEYIVDLNATNAAIRAGYSPKTAYSIASRLLRNVKIRARVTELMDERSKRTLVDADFVVRNLLDITAKCQQKVPVMEWNAENKCMEQKTDEEGKAIWEFDSSGANKALELLGRHLAMFTDKAKITTMVEQPLFEKKAKDVSENHSHR